MPTEITRADDERLADYVALTDVALRRRTEPERGLYIAESEKVIRRALTAGHRPRSYLMARRWLTDLADIVEQAEADGVPVFVGEHDVIEQLTGFHLHRGALAAMQRPVLPSLESLLEGARRVLVLEDVVDHTNVGAVFRSAAALGVDAVLVTPRCADPLYRRSIRVSMGTVFQVPWTRVEPWPQGIS
ncbi:MAG TPA: TrmH family RNA methyltransferase, partial [Pedococcus sp.]|nr:TrmH family RNA methyltransferase [Pedococcus sp.]